MILSDREIRAAIGRKALSINPLPPDDAWTSTAVDLTLAKELASWVDPGGDGLDVSFCPGHSNYNYESLRKKYTNSITIGEDGYLFKPGMFFLGWTKEKLKLPYESRVEGKSSLARLGIGVHITAPTIHAGFGYKPNDDKYPGSSLQLEMWNIGPLPVKLHAGMKICQLIFELVDGTPDNGYSGRFAVQGPDAAPPR